MPKSRVRDRWLGGGRGVELAESYLALVVDGGVAALAGGSRDSLQGDRDVVSFRATLGTAVSTVAPYKYFPHGLQHRRYA